MSTINIKCVDQVLDFQNMPIITAGDQNVDKIQFDFCPLWNGFIKVAVFFQQKSECSYALINADGSCNIPNSILKLEGKIFIAVTGTNPKNQVRTSNILSYYVDEGIVDASLQDEFPTDLSEEEKQDIYYQILEMCTDMQALCQDLIRNFAYVRVKGVNEFEYDESMIEAKIRAYTYTKNDITDMINDLTVSLLNSIDTLQTDINARFTTTENTINVYDVENKAYTDNRVNSLNDELRVIMSGYDTDISDIRNDISTINEQIKLLTDMIKAGGIN